MRIALLAMLAIGPASVSAQLYKCVGADGRTSYQSGKCATSQKESAFTPQDSSGVASNAYGYRIREMLMGIEVDVKSCSQLFPEWAQRNADSYAQYRRYHRSSLEPLENDPEFNAKVQRRIEEEARKYQFASEPQKRSQRSRCDDLVTHSITVDAKREKRQAGG
jgi:hypothetical protein